MRRTSIAMAWNFLGWLIFTLIMIIIGLIIMGILTQGSNNLLDKIFSWF